MCFCCWLFFTPVSLPIPWFWLAYCTFCADWYTCARLSPVNLQPSLYHYHAHELQRTEYERLINTCKLIFSVYLSLSLFLHLLVCFPRFFQLVSATTTIANDFFILLDTVSDYFVNDAMNRLFCTLGSIVSGGYSSSVRARQIRVQAIVRRVIELKKHTIGPKESALLFLCFFRLLFALLWSRCWESSVHWLLWFTSIELKIKRWNKCMQIRQRVSGSSKNRATDIVSGGAAAAMNT